MLEYNYYNNGFTLIELLVTIAIAAILITAGVPAFNQFITNNRTATQSNRLIRAFKIARSDAITRHATVTICAGIATAADKGECKTANDWKDGWIVFVDNDASGTFTAGDILLNTFSKLDGGNWLQADTAAVTYNPRGLSNLAGASWSLCDRDHKFLQGITISAIGSAGVSKTDINGNALDCI